MKTRENQNMVFEINNIYWERVFLNFEIKTENRTATEFYFKERGGQKVAIKHEQQGDNIIISLHIACVDGRSFLENGRWQLIALVDGQEHVCTVNTDTAYKMDDLSRVFKYAENQMAYNISFGVVSDDEKSLKLYLDSYFMIENTKWKKRRYVKEVRGGAAKVKRFFMFASIILIRIYYHVLDAIIPKRGNRILIMSETKDYLWGNLKFIDDKIKERGLDKKFKMSYSYRSAVGKHQSFKDIFSWAKVVTKVAAQDYVFIDDYAPVFGFFKLGKKTKLIQVWHAGEGFKSVGYSRFGKDGSPFPEGSCHKQYTHVITGSEHLVKVFQEVFAIEEEAFYPVGMPRLDGFLDKERIENFEKEFFQKYPALKGRNILLFAPTYRGAEQKLAYYDYDKMDLARINEFCEKNNFVFLIKMHPFVKKLIEIPEEYSENILEFTRYPNINDLYYVTDILVTDYSSNYFEYALMQRPVVFYTYDREVYELTRGVHRSIKESAPGKVCDTFDEFMTALENEDYEFEKTKQFVLDNFGDYQGNASDQVIDQILLKEEK